jgi:hypothetical protein
MNKIQPVDYNVFQGTKFQRGFGFGYIFKKLFKWVMPIFEQKAVPILKSVVKSIIKGTTNFAEDAIDGKNVKESAKRRFEESLDELSDKAGVMRGNGFRKPINNKRKKENNIRKKKNKNKRDFDIFDKK